MKGGYNYKMKTKNTEEGNEKKDSPFRLGLGAKNLSSPGIDRSLMYGTYIEEGNETEF